MSLFPAVPGAASPGAASPGDPGSLPAPVPSVARSWSGSYAPPLSLPAGAVPAPGNLGLAVPVAMPAGDWAVAVVSWRQPPNSPAVTIASVADDAHSWWEPLGAPLAASGPQGITRTVAWYAPRSRASTVVQCSPTGFVLALAMIVLDVTGMSDWILLTPVTSGWANQSAALSMSVPPVGAQAFMVAGAGSDLLTAAITGPGAPWSAVTPVTASNGSDHTSDLQLNVAWQVTSGESDANWAVSGGMPLVDFSGVLGGLFAAPAPLAQPNPNWPIVINEVAIGAGQYTPADTLNWQALQAPVLDLAFTQGRQYERDELATGDGSLTMWNPTGLALPPGFPQSMGVDSGTPARVRCYWPGGAWQVQFSGDGVHGLIGVTALNGAGFASPGQQVAERAWVGLSAVWAAGVTLVVNFYNAGLGLIQSFTSAVTSATAPSLLLVTGTAPAGTAFVNTQVQVGGTPPSSLVVSAAAGNAVPTGITASLGAWSGLTASTTITSQGTWAPDVRGAPNPTPWYVPFSGLIERLPQAWDPDVWQGFTDATITDQWASLTENMQSILAAELLEDNPADVWPCTDLATSLTAANIAPSNSNPLFVTQSKYGASGATQSFGQNGDALPGALGTLLINPQFRVNSQSGMWGQTLPSASFTANNGFSLGASGVFPPVSAGVTVEFWFQVQPPLQTGIGSMLMTLSAVTGIQVGVSINASGGSPGLQLTLGPGTLTTLQLNTVNYQVSNSPITHVALSFNRTTWIAYVNGIAVDNGSWSSPLAPQFSVVQFGNLIPSLNPLGQAVGAFGGFIGWCAIYPRQLHPLRILTHYQAGATAMSGDPASYRVERILAASTDAVFRRLIQYETSFTTGGGGPSTVVSCADLPGSPAGQGVTNVAGSIPPGMLFITPGGEIYLLTREKAFGQAYKWTFGEIDAGEIPYEADATLGYDPQHVVNLPQYTQLDSQSIVTSQVPAVTQASTNQYGQITANLTGYLKGDTSVALNFGPGLFDEANWLADIFSKPLMRGEVITVDAAENPSSWPVVLGASVGDPSLLNRRPLGLAAPGIISIPARISQTQRRLTFGHGNQVTGQLKLILDAMPEVNVLTADDPIKGQLNRVNVLGWLSICQDRRPRHGSLEGGRWPTT